MNSTLSQSRYPVPLGAVRRDLDRWFDQFFSPAVSSANGPDAWRPAAAFWEDENQFHLEVELPGVANDDVDVTFDKGVLAVTAERKAPEAERKYYHHDRRYGTLQLHLQLPESVDGDNIAAELKQGVLHLTLSKRPESQPKKISVKVTE